MTSTTTPTDRSKALTGTFPPPPKAVDELLYLQRVLQGGDKQKIAELGDISDLPSPWEPAGCDDALRELIWHWCDDVATWINRNYVWRPTSLIPACWPRHPHIAQELPVLACLHDTALHAHGPQLLEEWQRQTLPTFLERLAARLGDGGCSIGRHDSWPALPRYNAFTNADAIQERQDLFHTDTHPPTQLRNPHLIGA